MSGGLESWLWRYLVGDSPWFYPFWQNVLAWTRQGKLCDAGRIRLDLDRPRYGLGERVKVRARGAGLSPTLTVYVEPPEGKRESLELRQDSSRPSSHDGEYLPQRAGTYLIWTGDDDATRKDVRFSVQALSPEDRNPSLNEIVARRIAEASHQIQKGRTQSFDLSHLADLRKELEQIAKTRVIRRPTASIEVVGFVEGKRQVARGDDVTVSVRVLAPEKLVLRYETDGGQKGEIPLSLRGTNRYSAVLPAVKSTLTFRIASDTAQTEPYSVRVVDSPEVDRMRVWYSYPKIYKLEDTPADRPLMGGAIEAPAGTTVKIRVSAREAIQEATVLFERDICRLAVAGKEAEGSFVLTEGAGEYRIRFVAESGLSSRDPARFPIHGIADRAPDIRFIDPDCEIEDVSEICRRPIVFEATDDFGPVEVALEWRLVGRGEWKRVAMGRMRYELDLPALDPQPRLGDRVEVRAVAKDVGGRETSSTRSLIVRSFVRVERNVVDTVESADRTLSDLARRQLKIRDRVRRERGGEDEEAKLRFRLLASDQEDVADRLHRARIDLERAMNRGVFNGLFNQAAAERLARSVRELSGDSAREAAKLLGARNSTDAWKPQDETLDVIDRSRQHLLPWCDDRGLILRVRDLEDLLGDVVKALEEDDDASARRGLERMGRRAAQFDKAIARRTGDDVQKLSVAAKEVERRIAVAKESLEKGNRDTAWSQCEEISRGLESLRKLP